MMWHARRGRREAAPASPEAGEPVDGPTETSDHMRLARAAAANMAEAVAVIRATDGLIVYTNPGWDSMFGYPPGELEGRHISAVNAPTEQTPHERAREMLEALERSGSWRGAVHNVRKDGSHFWCEAYLSCFDHPEHGTVWISVNREITHRMGEDANLRATKERYQAAFERNPAATALLTADLRLADVNEAFCAVTGYAAEELIGKPLADITDPDDAGLDSAFFALVLTGEAPHYSTRRRYLVKQGGTVDVTVDARGLRETNGDSPYVVATVTRREPALPSQPESHVARAGAP